MEQNVNSIITKLVVYMYESESKTGILIYAHLTGPDMPL